PAQGQKRRNQPHQKNEQGQAQKSGDENGSNCSGAHQHDEQQRGPMQADQNSKRKNIKSETAWRGHHTDFPVSNKSGAFAPTAFCKKPGMGKPTSRTAFRRTGSADLLPLVWVACGPANARAAAKALASVPTMKI